MDERTQSADQPQSLERTVTAPQPEPKREDTLGSRTPSCPFPDWASL